MIQKKTISLFSILIGYMILMIGQSCVQEQLPDLYSRCPDPRNAAATDINVKYLPFKNDRFSTSSDIVPKQDFELVIDLEFDLLTENLNKGSGFGSAYALSCIPLYNFQNISNIAITLTKPLGNIQAGSDISYLFENREDIPLSEIRDFRKFEKTFGLKFTGDIENNSQLHTRTYLFLRDGRQIIFDSTSPIISTN
ncbi:hypothetical protein E4S40_04290 [Algoriphagus kandeliae]|uniref:DUF5034 domain-containing protein n=1 Tax=Algoriphagus kandeliae TaxID=2562278 RepID=A0A4Y9QZ78_9BACT|nr:hypothetical protein [Algoriphagus kandeliae]TFV97864.1 hypothetical protein E4S40_04290 [Algoriphagus kandeliae]